MPVSKRNDHNVGIFIVNPFWWTRHPLACVPPDSPPIRLPLFAQDAEDEQRGNGLREVDGDGALQCRCEQVRADLEELKMG